MTAENLDTILDKIAQNEHTEADLLILRQALDSEDRQAKTQLAKYIVNIGEGKELHIGDHIDRLSNEETIQVLLEAIQGISSQKHSNQFLSDKKYKNENFKDQDYAYEKIELKNKLIINHSGNKIQLSWQKGQTIPKFTGFYTFDNPFDSKVLENIRWYIEEFLHFPYGKYLDEAKYIEEQFSVWGQKLFELVFQNTKEGQEFFQEATRQGLNHCELSIISDKPAILNLPWELIYSPKRKFLAPSLSGMYRSLNGNLCNAPLRNLPQKTLNVLLVIARPDIDDKPDPISFRTIARPILESLNPIWDKVYLKVLRPPSFNQLERELSTNKDFYHIVHFDGHGSFNPESKGFQYAFSTKGQGILVFENSDGSAQKITAEQIAQSLTDCGVPIFILNACQSAKEGKASFSSVAAQLLSLGAKGVVAMAYSVHADGVKHFIGRLYEQLSRGDSLDRAVANARKEMMNQRLRSSPKGYMALADWIVPVLYQQENFTPISKIRSTSKIVSNLNSFQEKAEISQLFEFPEEGAYGFVGRDYDFLRLERAFRQNNVVLLKGVAGVGKTQLACGFSKWLQKTQGREGVIVFTSFEHGADLSRVINDVGRAIWGDQEFSRLDSNQQKVIVQKHLQQNSCLLIWDNFEPITGFSSEQKPLLSLSKREELKKFLKVLRNSASWVLITSRKEELWLDYGYKLVPLQGLSPIDAEKLASKILQTSGLSTKNLTSDYLDLLKILKGHPLSMRVILPHLKRQSPNSLVTALQNGLSALDQVTSEDKDKSVFVSLDYSFTSLPRQTRQHLPILSLFTGGINSTILYYLSGNSNYELTKKYQEMFNKALQQKDWSMILEQATEVGILTHLGSTYYEIHPALPGYLYEKLKEQHSIEKINELKTNVMYVYEIIANQIGGFISNSNQNLDFILQFEEPNLLKNLYLAEQKENWNLVWRFFYVIDKIYDLWGHKAKINFLKTRILKKIGLQSSEAKIKGDECFNCWLSLKINEASDFFNSGQLDSAKTLYENLLQEIIVSNNSSFNNIIGILHRGLGRVYSEQRKFSLAYSHLSQALILHQGLEIQEQIAMDNHSLGLLSHFDKRYDTAIKYYDEARKIHESLGDFYNAASQYHELGITLQNQGRINQARNYYQKAIDIYERLGDLEHAANDYHQLGRLAQMEDNYEGMRSYFEQALKIYEDRRNVYKTGFEYYNLAAVSLLQEDYEVARSYCKKSLEIFKRLDDSYQIGEIYFLLGNIEKDTLSCEQSKKYFELAKKIFEDIGDSFKLSQIYSAIGDLEKSTGDSKQALRYLEKSQDILLSRNDINTADVLLQKGQIEQNKGNLQKAQVLYLQSLKILEDTGNYFRAGLAYYQLGVVKYLLEDFQDSQKYCEKAKKIFEDESEYHWAADVYHQLASTVGKQQKFDEARNYSQLAINLYHELKDVVKVAGSYYNLGMIEEDATQLDKAIACYKKSLDIFEKAQDWEHTAMCLGRIGSCLSMKKNEESVIYYFRCLSIAIEHDLSTFMPQCIDIIKMVRKGCKEFGERQVANNWCYFTKTDFSEKVRQVIFEDI